MYRRFTQRRPQPVSTHPIEESLDKTYASLQSQLELVDKLQRIFGDNPVDPVIRFQIQKIKKALSNDLKKISFTGTDIHDLQQQFGSELVRSQIIQARKTIDEEKDGHGVLTDLVNDEQFAQAYQQQQQRQDPMVKIAMREHVQQEVISNPSRIALQDYYFRKGMPKEKAFNKSVSEYSKFQLSDQEQSLLGLLINAPGKLPTKQLVRGSQPFIDDEGVGEEEKERLADNLASREKAEQLPFEIAQRAEEAQRAQEQAEADLQQKIAKVQALVKGRNARKAFAEMIEQQQKLAQMRAQQEQEQFERGLKIRQSQEQAQLRKEEQKQKQMTESKQKKQESLEKRRLRKDEILKIRQRNQEIRQDVRQAAQIPLPEEEEEEKVQPKPQEEEKDEGKTQVSDADKIVYAWPTEKLAGSQYLGKFSKGVKEKGKGIDSVFREVSLKTKFEQFIQSDKFKQSQQQQEDLRKFLMETIPADKFKEGDTRVKMITELLQFIIQA